MKKFTLVELLVVIAILGILISMFLPSIQKTRNISFDTVCLSNVRQVGVGITNYTSKNDGKYPAHRGSFGSWIDLISDDDFSAFSCPRVTSWVYPNDNTFKPQLDTKSKRMHLSPYGYNVFWMGLSKWQTGFQGNPFQNNFLRSSQCSNPSQLITVADSSPFANGIWSSTLWYKWRKRINNNEGVKPAHGSKADESNIVFADGHAESYNAQSINFQDDTYKDWWNPDPDNYYISY